MTIKIILKFIVPLILSCIFIFRFSQTSQFISFMLGVIGGFWLILVDRLIHVFVLFPEQEFNLLLREAWQKKNLSHFIKIFSQSADFQEQLLTRSILFIGAYIVLTFFVLTSTGSALGIGMMFGIGARLLFDMLELRLDQNKFHRQFLWQLKRKFSESEVDFYIFATALFLFILGILILI